MEKNFFIIAEIEVNFLHPIKRLIKIFNLSPGIPGFNSFEEAKKTAESLCKKNAKEYLIFSLRASVKPDIRAVWEGKSG
jgi:hypothetical protein